MLSGFPNLLRIKGISSEVPESERPLKRVLGPVDLTMLGIGGIVGAGIFATVGTAAVGDETRPGAGPALVISFVLTAIACSFAALCYAEFASMAQVSGSAYSYAYAPSANWWPGSSAGTWSSNTPSAMWRWPSPGRAISRT